MSQSEKPLYHTRVNAINICFQMNGIASKAEKKMSCVMTVCILGKGPKKWKLFMTFAIGTGTVHGNSKFFSRPRGGFKYFWADFSAKGVTSSFCGFFFFRESPPL